MAWGLDLNSKDSEGWTPLHLSVWCALFNGNLRPMKLLLLKGASREIRVLLAYNNRTTQD